MTEELAHAIAIILSDLPHDEWRQLNAAFGIGWTPEEVIERVDDAGGKHCIVHAGDLTPVYAGGWFWNERSGRGESWALVSNRGRRQRLDAITLATSLTAKAGMKHMGSVDVLCLADRIGVHRWYEKLGWKRAEELAGYGEQREDFVRYEVT